MEIQATVEKPDVKVLNIWRWSNMIGYAIFAFVSVIAIVALVTLGRIPAWYFVFLVVPFSLWALSEVTLKRQWENWTFQVTPEALDMTHGWIWKNRRIVARDRIQHVDINSGPLDRRFGLVQVVVYTAGATVGMIPGLRPERAALLRDQLMAGRAVE